MLLTEATKFTTLDNLQLVLSCGRGRGRRRMGGDRHEDVVLRADDRLGGCRLWLVSVVVRSISG